MLRMTPSVSAEAAKTYFREALSRGEYYKDEKILNQEIAGEWGGQGARRLGLCGEVDGAAFHHLCDNQHPATGQRLTVRTKDNRRVGYDFNFHVPKSVSVAHALGGDERLLAAFRDSVQETMREMEREMQTRVRRGGADETRTTGNMVWAEFVHFTARPVNGHPDPHLHAHVFAFNATWDPVEERWKAGEFGDLKRDAPYFQAAYHARLAVKLRELGYAIERRGEGWEIADVPESVVRRFSRRTEEIERLAKELGITDPAGKAELGPKTRKRKLDLLTMKQLKCTWRRRMTVEEIEAIDSLKERARRRGAARLDRATDIDRSLDFAKSHVFEQQSTIPEKRLLAAALEHGVGKITPETMRRCVEQSVADGSILRAEFGGQRLVTTPQVLEEEQRMLATVRKGRGEREPLKAGHAVEDERLSDEQRKAVQHVLESSDSVVILRGKAGVGKTRTLREVVNAIASTGQSVQAAAPTAMATHEVLRREGFATAQTVASLLKRPETHKQLKGHVLWVDEAGLLSVPDMARLVELTESHNVRLLLTGDTRQHRSVIRGDALRLLETESGVKPAELTRIRRQQTSEYRLAAERLAAGDLEAGFAQLDRMGVIKELDQEQRVDALAQAYAESIQAGQSTLIVSPTHAEGRAVTQAIRNRLRQEGAIASVDTAATQLANRHLSVAERSDPASFTVGDVIEFHQNVAGGFRRSDRAEVVKVGATSVTVRRQRDGLATRLPLEQAERYQVYSKGSLSVAKGDLIRFTGNGRTADGRHRLNNGAIYQVSRILGDGRITLSNGWMVDRDFGHIAHGYCVTSDASQGRTVDHVILAQSGESAGASNQQQFYTSATRGRKQITIFTDDKERLLRAIARDASRLSATELLREAISQPPRQRGLAHRRSIGLWANQRQGQRRNDVANRAIEQRSRRRQRIRKCERGGFSRGR